MSRGIVAGEGVLAHEKSQDEDVNSVADSDPIVGVEVSEDEARARSLRRHARYHNHEHKHSYDHISITYMVRKIKNCYYDYMNTNCK